MSDIESLADALRKLALITEKNTSSVHGVSSREDWFRLAAIVVNKIRSRAQREAECNADSGSPHLALLWISMNEKRLASMEFIDSMRNSMGVDVNDDIALFESFIARINPDEELRQEVSKCFADLCKVYYG